MKSGMILRQDKQRKSMRIVAFAVMWTMLLIMTACADTTANQMKNGASSSFKEISILSSEEETAALPESDSGQIYLYGELHATELFLNKECELWYEYYHNEGWRHLFIEAPYYTAEFLNLWMQSDNDEILDAVYEDWQGTLSYDPLVKAFYQRIKRECPETVFHGTDIGHQYQTTGKRFLNYLQEKRLEKSRQYHLTQEAMKQGEYFYKHADYTFRENKMAENFVRAFKALDGENIMGIYGAAHVKIGGMDFNTQSVPNMASQLYKIYQDALHTEDESWVLKDVRPERIDTVTVEGKEYQASYFGKEEITGIDDFAYREFWRLENAYDDLKDRAKTNEVLPYYNYPMLIETGQVFLVKYEKTDGSILKLYYRSDGNDWNNEPATEGIAVE